MTFKLRLTNYILIFLQNVFYSKLLSPFIVLKYMVNENSFYKGYNNEQKNIFQNYIFKYIQHGFSE